jgi:uncharacterized membrane protein
MYRKGEARAEASNNNIRRSKNNMKWLSWSIVVLGLWILINGFMGAMNWVSIICGVVIAVLALMGALKS